MLGERAALFKRFYDVTAGGNWEGKNILNRLAHPALADDATEAELARCREMLLAGPRRRACAPVSTTRSWPTGTG